jgi:hypothetical protein
VISGVESKMSYARGVTFGSVLHPTTSSAVYVARSASVGAIRRRYQSVALHAVVARPRSADGAICAVSRTRGASEVLSQQIAEVASHVAQTRTVLSTYTIAVRRARLAGASVGVKSVAHFAVRIARSCHGTSAGAVRITNITRVARG